MCSMIHLADLTTVFERHGCSAGHVVQAECPRCYTKNHNSPGTEFLIPWTWLHNLFVMCSENTFLVKTTENDVQYPREVSCWKLCQRKSVKLGGKWDFFCIISIVLGRADFAPRARTFLANSVVRGLRNFGGVNTANNSPLSLSKEFEDQFVSNPGSSRGGTKNCCVWDSGCVCEWVWRDRNIDVYHSTTVQTAQQ